MAAAPMDQDRRLSGDEKEHPTVNRLAGAWLALPVLTPAAWTGTMVAAGLSAAAIASAFIGREHTLPGELLAAFALPAWGVPVALQGGVAWAPVRTAWGTWSFGYAAATCVG